MTNPETPRPSRSARLFTRDTSETIRIQGSDEDAEAPSPTATEFGFISWIRDSLPAMPADVKVGPGDDCAVWTHGGDSILLKVDSVVEGRHFQRKDPGFPGHALPEQIGRKAIARAVSDIAAMGGVPRLALCAAVIPAGSGAALREGIFHGTTEACAEFGIAMVGGDTSAGTAEQGVILSVTLVGEMKGLKPVLRSGAKPGDAVYVTGRLGASIEGRHLDFDPRVAEGRWLAQFGVSAMMDVSDGLAQDLWQITRESKVGAVVSFGHIPLTEDAIAAAAGDKVAARWAALQDGEDYELLFTLDEMRAPRLELEWPFPLQLTRLGQVTPLRPGDAPGEGTWIEVGGEMRRLGRMGYEHQL